MKIPEPRLPVSDLARQHTTPQGKSAGTTGTFAATLKSHVQREGLNAHFPRRPEQSANTRETPAQHQDDVHAEAPTSRTVPTATDAVAPKAIDAARAPAKTHARAIPASQPIVLDAPLPLVLTSTLPLPLPLPRKGSPEPLTTLAVADRAADVETNLDDFPVIRSLAYEIAPLIFEEKTAHSQTNLLMLSAAPLSVHQPTETTQATPAAQHMEFQQTASPTASTSDINVAVAADALGMQVYVRLDNAGSSNVETALRHVTDQLEQVGVVRKRITINGKSYNPDTSLFGDGNGNPD